jgi:hypothetical protein
MRSENETLPLADTHFAVDLRHQLEGLAEDTSGSRRTRGASAAASATRRLWFAVAGVAAAVAVAGAFALLITHPGSGPQSQLALASPTPVVHRLDPLKEMPQRGILGEPLDVTGIAAMTVDASGRPWLSGVRGKDQQPFVAYLDGGQWMQVPMPAGELSLGPVAVLSLDDLWASVHRGFAHWDGTTWQKTSVPVLDGDTTWIEEMAAVSTSDIWAVGPQLGEVYKTPGDGPGEFDQGQRPLTMHWDGTAWVEVKVPAMSGRSSSLHAVAIGGGSTWAVGGYEEKTGEQAQPNNLPLELIHNGPIALRWDGERWVDMHAPNAGTGGTNLIDVLVLAPNDVWVLGSTFHGVTPDQTVTTYLAHWDGSAWERVPPAYGLAWGTFWTVTGTSDGDIWLGGESRDGSGYPEAAHWDGAHWAIYPPATFATAGQQDSGGAVAAMPHVVAVSPTDVWFDTGITRFWNNDSRPADPLLFHWDGQSWAKVEVPF